MQVLARFDSFPYKKLETVRMASALFLKLEAIVTNLKNWKMVGPISQQLDKVESYFNKVIVQTETWRTLVCMRLDINLSHVNSR